MTPHDLIRNSFRSLQPSKDLEQKILSASKEIRHSHRILPRFVIVAAIICCLVLSVAAVSYTCGWLDPWFDTESNPDYFKTNTLYPQAEASVDGLSITLDKFLCEGPYVYYQITLYSETGFSGKSYWEDVHTEIAYPEPIVCIDSETQDECYDYGPGSVGADQRLDDGSDPSLRVYAVRLALSEYESYAGQSMVLSISKEPTQEEINAAFPEGVALKEVMRYEFKPENKSYREAELEDGTLIRINSLGVGIQGYHFFGWADTEGQYQIGSLDATVCGVILKDGTRLNFLTSTLGYSSHTSSENYWNNSPLPKAIDPWDVEAIFTPDKVYSIE